MTTPCAVSQTPLKLLPAYTGAGTLRDALGDARALRLLWLEILVNDELDLTPWWTNEAVRQAYGKACRWYTTYGSLVASLLDRKPLPRDTHPIDPREYRTFIEAIQFAAAHH